MAVATPVYVLELLQLPRPMPVNKSVMDKPLILNQNVDQMQKPMGKMIITGQLEWMNQTSVEKENLIPMFKTIFQNHERM